MIISVYRITNKLNNVCYIGVSKDPSKRFKQHCKWTGKSLISKAIRKYGKFNFELDILCRLETYKLAYAMEYYCIQRYNSLVPNGYNLTGGGLGSVNMSNVTRNKMSNLMKERMADPKKKKAFKKLSCSKEINKKRSNTLKVLWKDSEFRKKMKKDNIRTKK